MTTTLVIARHGNTFHEGETPRRVGARTDLPLTETHKGTSIGMYLREQKLVPDAIFAAPLKRTMQTAQLAADQLELSYRVQPIVDFTEIDYGPDENHTEDEVMLRLGDGDIAKGKDILDRWNRSTAIPQGWNVDAKRIVRSWGDFAAMLEKEYKGKVVMLVSSNGIIRFAPYLTGDFEGFAAAHDIKVSPGGVCVFTKEEGEEFWTCKQWNVKPFKIYSPI